MNNTQFLLLANFVNSLIPLAKLLYYIIKLNINKFATNISNLFFMSLKKDLGT